MTKRKALSKKTRFEVFKRDGFSCQYCGAHPPQAILHVDHIVAVSAGGENDIDNLITACLPCNLGKGARDLEVAPQSLKDKAAAIAEREEQLRGYHAVLEAQRDRLEEETWRVVWTLYGEDKTKIDRRIFQSIFRFVQQLGVHDVIDAAEIALAKFPYQFIRSESQMSVGFRYFCGICWKRIREDNNNGPNQNDQA